tara:strand:+ start:2056 stop:2667 length:612 start_codon:yes stop_codon:yes gene_type:complete
LNTSTSQENKLSNKLQQDVIKIAGKTIFINPFLYWRRFDEKTNRWLRDPGQIPEEQIKLNRTRFYPELDWSMLSQEDKIIKDGTVEMFLKTLDLVNTFHPDLNVSQILQIERKMSIVKKHAFEKWVKNSFAKRAKTALKERRKFQRERFVRTWHEWFSLETTHQALLPIFIMVFLSSFIGWSAGISKNSCNPYFESETQTKIK